MDTEVVVRNQNRSNQVVSDKRRLAASALRWPRRMKLALKEKLLDEWRKVEYCCGHNNGSKTIKGGQIISRGRFLSMLQMLDYPDGEAIDLRMLPP